MKPKCSFFTYNINLQIQYNEPEKLKLREDIQFESLTTSVDVVLKLLSVKGGKLKNNSGDN